MADITQKLPLELLAEILVHTHAQDILRFKQVNRAFRDAILASPLLQHMTDLFTTGLEYNVAAGVSLDDSRKALLQYRSRLDFVHPIEERTVRTLRLKDESSVKAADGMLATVDGSVQLFTLGPASRGISYKEWEIPLPVANPTGYGFCPSADVIAFVEQIEADGIQINVYLRALSDGGEHPAARFPVIHHSQAGSRASSSCCVSITSSRLAVLTSVGGMRYLIVWDWRSAQALCVERGGCNYVKFIDDYRLLGFSGASWSNEAASLRLMDTGGFVGASPVQTVFYLPSHFRYSAHPPFLLEHSARRPSTAMSPLPFRCDPTQRIVVLQVPHPYHRQIFRVWALLELHKGRGGSQVGWDEWKNLVAMPTLHLDHPGHVIDWVSGCRLFSAYSMNHMEGTQLVVHDFNLHGHRRYLREQIALGPFGGLRPLSSTGKIGHLPWKVSNSTASCSSHDTAVFIRLEDGDVEPDQREMLILTF